MERPATLMSAKLSARRLVGTPPEGGEGAADPHEIGEQAPVTLPNLQNDMETLAGLLPGAVRVSSLDAFLLAAGLNQIAEDHLHPEVYPLDRAAEYLAGQSSTLGRAAGRAAAGLAGARRFMGTRRRDARHVLRWQREVGQLVETLAGEVAGGSPGAALASCDAIARVEELPPRLRRSVIRLPACFQSFDQQPADVARLVRDFSSRWPDRDRSLLVTGVRTSGSYLAPLCAAFLRADGYERISVLTIRPGRPLLAHERRLVRSVARAGGMALVTDDPPVTGKGIASSARDLEKAGIPPASVVLLLQLLGNRLPVLLERYPGGHAAVGGMGCERPTYAGGRAGRAVCARRAAFIDRRGGTAIVSRRGARAQALPRGVPRALRRGVRPRPR